ncbi:Urb2/Npa2 family-domain-containing protein [Obelidium mucronatum]|nr:Urb2/Npa2 family-domain-containing protein [Obelidium mucronatum]
MNLTAESVHQFLTRDKNGSLAFAEQALAAPVLVQHKPAAFVGWALRRCLHAAPGDDQAAALRFLALTLETAPRNLAAVNIGAREAPAVIAKTILANSAAAVSPETIHVLLMILTRAERVAALKPSFEQVIDLAAVVATCAATNLAAIPLALHILKTTTTSAVKTNPNLKKVFQQVLSKLLVPLLRLRYSAVSALKNTLSDSSNQYDSVISCIHTILDASVFHKDHVAEFVPTLQTLVVIKKETSSLEQLCGSVAKTLKDVNSSKSSYPKQFFDVLLESLKDGPKDYIVKSFPYLLSSFIDARKRHFRLHDSNLVFSADFSCFIVLMVVLLQSSNNSPKNEKVVFQDSIRNLMLSESEWRRSAADHSAAAAGIVGQLIRVLVDKDVYKATQDDVSKSQLSIFKDMNAVFIQVVGKLEGAHQGVVFDVLGSLMQIDYSIVLDSIDSLWCFLVLPDEMSRSSALDFTILLLQTLTKSRELENFLIQCFNAISGHSHDALSRSILLDEQILKTFSTSITKTLPAQIPRLLAFLIDQFFESDTDAEKSPKRNTSTSGGSSTRIFKSPESISILVELLSRTIKSGVVKVVSAPALRKSFDQKLDDLFDNVVAKLVVPVSVSLKTGTKRQHEVMDAPPPSQTFLQGLSLLYSMMQASEDFWKRKVDTEFIVSVMMQNHHQVQLSPKEKLLKIRVALFHAECVASNSLDPKLENLTANLVTMALEDVESVLGSEGKAAVVESSWDGSLERLKESNLGVAVWACVLDHLVPVCHLCSVKQVQRIVTTLIDAINSNPSDELQAGYYTLPLLSASLLQSSQFYELRMIRDIFLPSLIASFLSELKAARTESEFTNEVFKVIESSTSLHSISVSVAQLLSKSKTQNIKLDARTVARLTQLVSILNTFPTVYFQNNERDCIVGVLVLLEVLVSGTMQEKKVDAAVLRFAAICRKLEARFMESRDDTLITLYSPKVLEWMMASLERYTVHDSIEIDVKQYFAVLKRETLFIEELTLTKLFQRFSGTLPKGSVCPPSEYLTSVLASLGNSNASNWLDLVLHFTKALVSSVHHNKKHVDDMDVDTVPNQVVEVSSALLINVERRVLEQLERVRTASSDGGFTDGELDGFVSGFRVFEQLLAFKEAFGSLSMTKTVNEMFEFADASLSTMSRLIQGVGISGKIVDLGALFLSIQLHQLEALESVEASVLETLVSSSGALLKAAWKTNPSAVSVIHGSLSAFAAKSTSNTMVPVLITSILDHLESLLPLFLGSENILSNTSDLPAALNLLVVVVTGIQKSGKRGSLRRVLQRIVVDLSRIVEGSKSIDLTLQSITLLTRLTEDKILDMNRSDVSLVLNACTLLASKQCPLYNAAVENFQNGVSTYLGPDDLFDALCRLLTTILTQRREALVDSIPAFVGVIRGLFHCFKKELGGLRSESGGASTHVPVFTVTPYPIFSKLPLENPVLAAESLARILEKMTQKSAVAGNSGNTGAGGKETAVAHTILQSNAAATVRPFAKHAGLLVAEFVSIQASISPFPGAVKKALLTGVYALLDLSGEFGRKAVLAGLDTLQYSGENAAKLVFKDIVKEWEGQSYRGKE